jgi:hypothetical protein
MVRVAMVCRHLLLVLPLLVLVVELVVVLLGRLPAVMAVAVQVLVMLVKTRLRILVVAVVVLTRLTLVVMVVRVWLLSDTPYSTKHHLSRSQLSTWSSQVAAAEEVSQVVAVLADTVPRSAVNPLAAARQQNQRSPSPLAHTPSQSVAVEQSTPTEQTPYFLPSHQLAAAKAETETAPLAVQVAVEVSRSVATPVKQVEAEQPTKVMRVVTLST